MSRRIALVVVWASAALVLFDIARTGSRFLPWIGARSFFALVAARGFLIYSLAAAVVVFAAALILHAASRWRRGVDEGRLSVPVYAGAAWGVFVFAAFLAVLGLRSSNLGWHSAAWAVDAQIVFVLAGAAGVGAARTVIGSRGMRRPAVALAILAAIPLLTPLIVGAPVFARTFVSPRSSAPAPALPGRPDVLLIVIDSLRADALSSYGETRWSTPRIDAVAASGVRFADVTSASPSSTPSTVSILSSRLPEDHGVCGTHGRIREGIPTLATAFRSHGYQTVAIAAGPLLSRLNGIDEGFDRWDEDTDPSFVSSHPRVLTASFMGMFGRKRREESPPADEMVERASQHLAGGSPAPRFVFLQLMDPHDPYAPPGTGAQPSAPGTPSKIRFRPGTLASILRGEIAVSDDDVETARILYGREVESVDAAVGRLLDELRARIESGSLIVALTSNHGEEFMEHGSLGHGHSLHEEVIRVPLIVSRAGAAIRGTEIAEPVSLLDLAPTLLDLAGVPAEPAFAGRSLRPLVEGRAGDETRRSPIVSQMDAVGWHTTTRWARSAREGRYKVVFSATNVLGTGEWSRRIYDLGSDPAESAPANESGAAADLPAGARALAAWLDGHVRDRSPLAVPRDQGDPQRIRRLRSLGYVD